MMHAATLTDRITLQRLDLALDTFVTLPIDPRPWAEVEQDGDERYRFRIRARGDLRGLQDCRPSMRVLYYDRILEVIDVAREASQRGEEIVLTAQASLVKTVDLRHHVTQVWPQDAV